MSTLTVKVAGTAYTIKEATLTIKSRVDDKDTAVFTLIEPTGTVVFSKGQTVSITDSVQGNLFSGFINKPTCTNLFPNATNEWSIDCVNQFYVPAKRTHKRLHKGQHAAPIVALQVQEYLEPDGVSGNFGLDWTELQSDWQAGTHSGTSATTNTSTGNVGAGDLELSTAGGQVTFTQQTQADFNAGTTGFGLFSPSTGGVTFTPTQAIKFSAMVSVAGISNAGLAIKIWSGSYTIAASDDLYFDIWIADSCPQQMASLDFVLSDGTRLSASVATVGTDFQNVGPAITNDLSGLATNQWYNRRFFLDGGGAWVGKTINYVTVSFGGSNQGTYTAYLRNAYIVNGSTTKLTIFSKTATATQTTPQPVQNNGYSSVSCTVVTAYERHGFMYSPTYDISGAGIVNTSNLNWNITLPNSSFGYSITASIDGFATFLPCTLNTPIPGLLAGMSLSGIHLNLVYVFNNAGNDPTLTPFMSQITGTIIPSYSCTKSDIVSKTDEATGWLGGTLTNLVQGTGNQLQLNGYARDWSDGNYGNQTLYGSVSPSQIILNKTFTLTSGTGADAKSRADFAGSNWQNFTMEVDILISGNFNSGLNYRTTNWNNANNTYAYLVDLSPTHIFLSRGSNSGSSGTNTAIQSVAFATALTSGSWHRLKIIVNGSNHQAFLDDIAYINATDATFTAAGYVGFHIFNGSGSTQTATFDNFGIMAALSGTWVSPAIDIHSLTTISNSQIILQIDPNINTSISTFLVEISLNNGSTWTTCTNVLTTPVVLTQDYFQSLPVPGLPAGTNVSSMTQVLLRLTISASTAATGLLMPDVTAVTLFVIGAYSSTGTRTNAPLMWDSMNRLPVSSGFGNASNGQAYTQSGIGTTATTGSEATISNTTGDLTMQAGTNTSTDTEATCNFSLSSSSITGGVDLHYTNLLPTYAASLAVNTPIRDYRMTETSGTVANDSGSQAQNGTITGGVTLGQTGLIPNTTDTSMLFNGSTGYISLPTTGLPTGANPWSVECWFSVPSITPFNPLFVMGATTIADNGMQLNVHSSTGHVTVGNATTLLVQSSSAVSVNTPYFVAVTYDGTTITLYLYNYSGLVGTFTATHTFNLTYSSGVAYIGRDWYSDFLTGTAQGVNVYSTALSSSAVNAHWQAGASVLANYYRLAVNTTSASLIIANGSFIRTMNTAPLSLSTNTSYSLRFRVVGSGPTNFYGKVWPNDGVTKEPSAWTVTATL